MCGGSDIIVVVGREEIRHSSVGGWRSEGLAAIRVCVSYNNNDEGNTY